MKIVVAVDGSEFTRKALDYIAAQRSMFVDGHELLLVHVCPGLPPHASRHIAKDTLAEYYNEEGAKVIEPVKQQLQGLGIANAAVQTRHGQAAEEIVRAAKEAGAGLVVMGTRGQGALGRALMGSVATKVIAESDLPVLLVQ
ncbi:universal stress protein [Pseudacidovorax intermedius]|uniref:Universal stress protein UspA n=1 Tax=Pseudacidovorax intermedius TaxID=433924 RepID=A0A147GNB4_9BURK|nr:universal stress protein [Pseudacidovorax intermedius]KTT15171.1 universal stress protein UspA [Pseudacidovorax intermedius]